MHGNHPFVEVKRTENRSLNGRRSRCYYAGNDLAGGLVGPNWQDVAAWVSIARTFIEGHFTLRMEVQAMIHKKTYVVIAAALWRSGGLLTHAWATYG